MKRTLLLFILLTLWGYAIGQCENGPVPNVTITNNNCGEAYCFFVTTTGGTAPYTYSIPGGPVLNPNAYGCTEVPGIYTLLVTDAAGCTGQTQFTVVLEEDSNNSCETAMALENGVAVTDQLCDLIPENPAPECFDFQVAMSGWFSVNSEEFSHIHLGYHTAFNSNPGSAGSVGIRIYASENNGDCSAMTPVFCGVTDPCINFEDLFTVTPDTRYYIQVLALWTSPVTINIAVELSNEPIENNCGCTDPASCNYTPGAIVDDGSCGHNGCMDASACNYSLYATCDDGSCMYGNDLSGMVFHDVNGNGVRDTWPSAEPLMPNAGYITIDELNVQIYPDAQGSFVLPGLELGTYTITFHNTEGSWVITGGNNTQSITLPTCVGLPIPLTPVSGVAAQVSGSNWSGNAVIQCNNGFTPGIWIQNTGTVPISGTFTMTFDPSFVPQNLSYAIPYTDYTNGILTWEISGLAPGSNNNLMVHIPGPGPAFVGTVYPFTFSVSLNDGEDIFYSNTWTQAALVSCAYDPNDKQATPEGYAEPHFILTDTEIEYKIRFQNTGNAPAFDVVIEDQLDIERLDLSSFTPVTASHSYSTIVQPDGLIRFVFNNIMLPDSTLNEPESHGYVIYRIRTMPGIEAGEEIHNSAAIFFDDNPPIITNTTLHTIYDCTLMPSYDETIELCINDAFQFIIDYPYIENYQWYVNEEAASTAASFTQVSFFGENWQVGLTLSNPLCTVQSQWDVIEHPSPSAEVLQDPETGLLTAVDGVAWQWYVNNEPVEGATQQNFTPQENGDYFVFITSPSGCSVVSETISITGVSEITESAFLVYPNPATDHIRITSPAISGRTPFGIFDITGKMVTRGFVQSDSMIEVHDLVPGLYRIRLDTGDRILSRTFIRK